MARGRILVVDDEPSLRDLITLTLEREGYAVTSRSSGEEALAERTQDYDLAILDVMLPGKDGFEVCRELRRKSSLPIIMLTARSDTMDKVLGLELGADDYVTKPFEARELVARVRTILRRVEEARREAESRQAAAEPERLEAGDLVLSLTERQAYLEGRSIPLTPKEFALLEALMSQPGRVWTRELLLERVWGYDFAGDTRTVDIHVQRLRKKIEPSPAEPRFIQTVHGAGYRFRGGTA
ncbi:MAG: winged helix-turn-helix domain-containing protein [Bacillota bacterium]